MIVGHGLARHHFWGDYKATIVVAFKEQRLLSPESIIAALPSFTVTAEEDRLVARFFGGDTALDVAIAELVAAGATQSKILSLAHSIDWGEPFDIDITPAPKEVQQDLFAAEEAGL